MADLLHRLGYLEKGHLVHAMRDDLVGEYIGQTAPKTKRVLDRAMGGVLFIDEAYYLYRDSDTKDYGQEAIEILLQVMENERDKLVVILAGYKDRMDDVLRVKPRDGLPDRASPRFRRLRRQRAGGHRPAHAEADPVLPLGDAEDAFRDYITRQMDEPAVRQRAQRPQRVGARPAPPRAPSRPPTRTAAGPGMT